MAERELFVICNNCGSEVSPYVTECPYCGQRLRKRAPDIKKLRRQEEQDERKADRKAERERKRVKRVLTGGGSNPVPVYLQSNRPPLAITALIVLSVIASLAARVDGFPLGDMLYGNIGDHPWQLFSAPFFHFGFGYGAVCLIGAALFGSGIERRFGPVVLVAVWLICGAAGVAMEQLVASVPVTNGAIGVAAGMMAVWLMVVLMREDLRDYDSFGLIAVSVVLLALPIATVEASTWTIIGGLVAGIACGGLVVQLRGRGA